jgi:UDPglucose--hexose-1-phosphate uridylyltransferase
MVDHMRGFESALYDTLMDAPFSPNAPHRRLNPLTGEFVLVSPHRTQRPWQGKVETPSRELRPAYDPTCYLCPGNARAGGAENPAYQDTFVFTNDFAALLPDAPTERHTADPLFQAEGVTGLCRVICFSPRHDLTLAEMEVGAIRKVVDLWAAQVLDLGARYHWVQIFESKGAIVGASNPHPHGQIWASDFLPNEARTEDDQQRRYLGAHGSPLLVDYAAREITLGERVVVENAHWLVVVPYWAYWPYETLVLPKRHVLRLPDLTEEERDALADILREMLGRFDRLFETSFPYCSGWHGAPTGDAGGNNTHWQLHAHYYPPLLRSASVQKFVASYEWLAEAQRDLSPEGAAARLREL